MIHFKIKKSTIDTQKNIHSIEQGKFNSIIHPTEFWGESFKIKKKPKYDFGALGILYFSGTDDWFFLSIVDENVNCWYKYQ